MLLVAEFPEAEVTCPLAVWSMPLAKEMPAKSAELQDAAHATTSELVRRLYRETLRPQITSIWIAVFCMVVVAGVSAGMVYLLQPIIDEVLIARDRVMLYFLPVLIIVLALVRGVAGYGESYLLEVIGHRMVATLQSGMYARVIRADLGFFHDNSVGNLVARFVNDANLLRQSVARSLTGMVRDLLTVICLLAVLFLTDWVLALLTLVVFPVSVIPIVLIGRRIRRISRTTQVETADLTTLLDETFRGIQSLKAYAAEESETRRALQGISRIYGLMRKSSRVQALSRPLMETLGGIAMAIAVFFGGLLVIGQSMTAGELIAFMTALLAAYKPMKSIANLNAILQQGLAAAQRIFQIRDLRPEIGNRPTAMKLYPVLGDIRFEDVHFGYAPGEQTLEGVDLHVPAGKTVALVGPSGAGKSTVLSLVPRFFDVDRGAIRVDGTDIRDITLESLRAGIAVVTQETSLFDVTIRANIAYGKPEASDAEIAAAARNAEAHDFIMGLPDGYQTKVGGRGVKLSGGQRQRIAIARAMLRDSPILLLDEATSALDTETERTVQAAINRLKKGRTTMVIAHRLSTIVDADAIFVLENGRVVETGTHAELLSIEGAFARLYELQFSGDQQSGPEVSVLG